MASLNRLSCVRCKDRKVRCSRTEPRCEWCTTHGLECEYPERQKRKSKRPEGSAVISKDALDTILDRLQRIERQQQAQSSTGASPRSTITTASGLAASIGPSPSSYDASPAPLLLGNTPQAPSQYVQPSSWLDPSRSALLCPGLPEAVTAWPADPADHAMKVMCDAMECVHRLQLQSFGSSIVTDEIKVPAHLARTWMRKYFEQKPTDMFLKLIDRDFFEMMPDMMASPHVHLDSCVLVIYYCILWFGCNMLDNTPEDHRVASRWSRLMYMGCLRALPAWQREATGCMTDLIAAVSLTRVAGTSFDYEMSWKAFKLACEYAQGLGLHNLDGGDRDVMSGIQNPDISDDDRKAFWDLIQVDAFFRLMFDKPPSLSGNGWKVNLPWLDPTCAPELGGGATTGETAMMLFLVSSRVTLLLLQFFSMLEEAPADDPAEMLRRTEDMCREIRSLYDGWQPLQHISSFHISLMEKWMMADHALRGYTCIIFMLRKLTVPGDPSTQPLALDVARQIVGVVSWLLAHCPWPATLTAAFGPFRAYVPFAYVAAHLLRCDDVTAYAADVEALEKATRGVRQITTLEGEFSPLAKAMEGLSADVRKRFNEKSGGMAFGEG